MNYHQQKKLIEIGESVKTHGYQGEVKCMLSIPDYEQLLKESVLLFFDIDGAKVPLKIKTVRGSGLLILSFYNKNFEEIKEYVSRKIYLENSISLTEHLDTETHHQATLVGYNLFEKDMSYAGNILSLQDIASQIMATVKNETNPKLLYIPIVEEWIVEINHDSEFIIMDLPDGILDL